MAALDMFRRGWGWVWLLGAVELLLVGSEALPLFRPTPMAHQTARRATQTADGPARVSLQPILDFEPFGAPDIPVPVEAEPEPVAEIVPATPMLEGYILQGVLFRDDGVPSRAILAWNGSAPASYVAGDVLPSGATLAGIEANRVWLEQDGEKQFLEFPVSGSALPETTGSDLPAEPEVSTDGEPATPADDTASPPPDAQIMPQPDLRNLIPGLVASPPSEN